MNEQFQKIISNKTTWLIIAVLLIALIIYLKFFRKSKEEKAAEETADEAIKKAKHQEALLSYDKFAYNGYADSIYEALRYSAVSDDKPAAVETLKKMKNDADVTQLIAAFGTRQEYFFGLPTGSSQSLPQFVTGNLSYDQRSDVNADYASKQIKYQF